MVSVGEDHTGLSYHKNAKNLETWNSLRSCSKMKQFGFTLRYCVQMMLMGCQKVQTVSGLLHRSSPILVCTVWADLSVQNKIILW